MDDDSRTAVGSIKMSVEHLAVAKSKEECLNKKQTRKTTTKHHNESMSKGHKI